MPYKRPILVPPKEHPIQLEYGHYKALSAHLDSGWERSFLDELMSEGRFALGQVSDTIDTVKSMNLSDYKPEVANKKRNELIYKARSVLLGFLKRHIETAANNVSATQNKILRMTENEPISDPLRAIERLLLQQEIRNLIRQTDPKHRHDFIAQNPEFIKACVASPDPLISPENLEKLRLAEAYRQDPSLQNELNDAELIYRKVRNRASEISAVSVKMLIDNHLDDPVPPTEHFSVFPPQTDRDREIAARVIQTHERKQTQEEKKRLFDEKNLGLNFEVQARAQRAGRRA